MMLQATTGKKGTFEETDPSLSAKLREEGFGFQDGSLHALEAAYLASKNRASFQKSSLASFLSSQKKDDKLFPFALAAYSCIRSAGRMVRPYSQGMAYLRVYAPGVGREEERPSVLLFLLPGKVPSAKTLEKQVAVAHLARLDLVIACGSEAEMKFYKISSFNF